MQFEKLTIKSQEALGAAQSHATERGHTHIEAAHLLLELRHPSNENHQVLRGDRRSCRRRHGVVGVVGTLTWWYPGIRTAAVATSPMEFKISR